ncbi:MAG: PrgI family protein [Candidatus Roizmanbacteria bacterium]
MEQHAIPRDVTGFSFKLIGFMTLKQFVYLIVAAVVGYLFFLISPIVILGQIIGVAVFCVGLIFAFIPVNDRPMEVFIKNLYAKLSKPTQYFYHKSEPPLALLSGLYYEADPHIIFAHVDSKEKLAAYLSHKQAAPTDHAQKQHQAAVSSLLKAQPPQAQAAPLPTTPGGTTVAQITQPPGPPQGSAHPFISGTVTNRKRIPLPGILLYVRDPTTKKVLRILKTNPHGVFASFHPLALGEYIFEAADSAKNYVFDPQNINLAGDSNIVTFVSRELLS